MEEIRGVTYDFTGERLFPFQAAQYLYQAASLKAGQQFYPFREAKTLMTACAVMGGESLWYLKAWHANVARNPDGTINRPQPGMLTIKSIDLGWIQRNADIEDVDILDEDVEPLVQELFSSGDYAYLDRPARAAEEAARLFIARGWQPWYAYSNGGWKRHLPNAGVAVANFLAVEFGLGQSYYQIRPRA